ncbi:MAG: assimilatory sulfite reductase (NADPH) flavoprotein subunit [Pseudomonadota bacterium]|nr:assimilatory sulfite reductase (NADPH) flavoprotein subunit [Pseudomonadota bacterium]
MTANPLTADQASQLQALTRTWDARQLLWASGFLAGQAARPSDDRAIAGPEVTLLYLSQSGNSEKLIRTLARRLTDEGCVTKVFDALDYRKARLKQARYLLIAASTHGEGDPPDAAAEFYDYLMDDRAPRFAALKFAVLALGDSSYAQFCKIGRDLDARLEQLGAQRLVPLQECDLDFDQPAAAWMDQVTDMLAGSADNAVAVIPVRDVAATSYSRSRPFAAELHTDLVLSGRGSTKEVHHVELSLEGSGIAYRPGDSIGVIPRNDPALVAGIIDAIGASQAVTVPVGEDSVTLAEALASRFELHPLTRPVVQGFADLAGDDHLRSLLAPENSTGLNAFLRGRDLLDLLTDCPLPGLDPAALVGILRKLPARLYSIASGPSANPGEVHLTVAAVRYRNNERDRVGTATGWLADRVAVGDSVPVYLDENPNFRLPADPDTPIIMVGPGTGVAPFRAFIEEREAVGAAGRSWLFFGDRHFTTDFLYQREWQGFLRSGALTRMDVAFSRDQADRVYVQHRLLERAAEIYAWLEEGACFYVCGDANAMAPDVDRTLRAILRKEGGFSEQAAGDYLEGLKRGKRYQRDVY